MSTAIPAISVRQVSKSFGSVRALDALDLEVRTGEVHGFLGPNGAGKSTAIRVLLGLLRADGGQASLLGGDPWSDAVTLHARLAYVPGDVDLWPNLTGGEALDLIARLHGAPDERAGSERDRRRTELLSRFELDPTRRIRTYSTGNRRKVVVVAVLLSALAGPASCAPSAAPCCSAATSSARSRPWPTGSPSSARAGRSRPAPWPTCAISPAPA